MLKVFITSYHSRLLCIARPLRPNKYKRWVDLRNAAVDSFVYFLYLSLCTGMNFITLQVCFSIYKTVDAEIAAATDCQPEFINVKKIWALHFLDMAPSNHV